MPAEPANRRPVASIDGQNLLHAVKYASARRERLMKVNVYRKGPFSIHVSHDVPRKQPFSMHVLFDMPRKVPFPRHVGRDWSGR
jgi:hypothetical protein